MAFCEIGSNLLTVKISSKGAELKGLYRRGYQHNWVWSAGEQWGRSAPHLFPIVGKLAGDVYFDSGIEYKLSQHGFARDCDFELISHDPSSALFRLNSNAQTRLLYPFDFSLDVSYWVEECTLYVGYQVQNLNLRPMLFNIGWHPGFVLPDQADLPLRIFASSEFGPCHLLKEGLVESELSYEVAKGQIALIDRDSFVKDAWVFLSDVPKKIEIRDVSGNSILINTGQAPFLGVWSKDPSKFLCIEPWWGVADLVGAVGQLETKYGIQRLEAGDKWQAEMSVEIRGADEGY